MQTLNEELTYFSSCHTQLFLIHAAYSNERISIMATNLKMAKKCGGANGPRDTQDLE